MSHRSTGAYKILERPGVYERFQRLLGAHEARQRMVEAFLRPVAGARVLDIGCGTGSLLDYLPAGVEYTGFDPNPAYIDRAQRRRDDRARFYCARIGQEPPAILEDQFDFVVAKSLLHHLGDEDAHHLLAVARRVLRLDGVFFSSDPVFHEGQRRAARWLASLDRGRSVRSPDGYRDLVEAHFAALETWLITDMLPIPYDHFVVRARAT
jgi:SAM-dependent methyltransferase